jgi:uncharacterized protein YecE (DUF72 family)
MIRIGTSGFSYADWAGPVYPEDLPERDRLAFYARQFSTVELNVTYYRIPDRRLAEGWAQKTPDGFLFAVKAFQGLTHERENPEFAPFVAGLEPLAAAGKLGCVLAQFPNAFRPSAENRAYLAQLREGFGDLPVVVELRNSAWVNPATFEALAALQLGFCCVDEPKLPGLMPPVAVASGGIGYVRFHGRNAAKWYNHKEAWERSDYTYPRPELEEWVPRLRALDAAAPLTLVYFNNHYGGQAVRGARDLGQLLLGLD